MADVVTLTENAIRPRDLMEREKEYFKCDLEFLLARQDRFVAVDCPACNSARHFFCFEKNGIQYHLCEDCDTVFVNPRPSVELLGEFYAQSARYDFWNKYVFPASERARREKIFRPRAERTISLAEKFLPKFETLMEVGAGFGTFCELMAESGQFKRILVLEPSSGLAETCRSRNLETLEMPVESLPDGVKVDIIASFEVIEHLFSAKSFLQSCVAHLNNNGLIILSCPNYHGFDIQTLGLKSDSIDHEHLNYFNPSSLGLLVGRCGFRVLELLTPGKLDADIVRNFVLRGEVSLDGQPFLETVLVSRWSELGAKFQQFLAENLMSGHMWVVAQKRAG